MTLALLVISAAVLSAVLTGVARTVALRLSVLDAPNARSSHTRLTPRGGGLAVVVTTYVGFLVGAALRWPMAPAVFLPGLLVAAVGWLDDRRGVSSLVRLTTHFACAIAGVIALSLMDGPPVQPLVQAFEVVATVAAINFFNFMDGIDGIAGVEAVSIGGFGGFLLLASGGAAAFGLGVVALVVAASAMGFLFWNWPPARVFLGDVGSGFLGYTFAMLAFAASRASGIPVLTWIVLGGVFAVDATATLLRRMAHGERWYSAHRSHAYQRASRRLGSHRKVTLGTAALNLVLASLAAVTVVYPSLRAAGYALALACLVGTYLWVERRAPMFETP